MDILYENLVTIGLLVLGVIILSALLVALVPVMLDVDMIPRKLSEHVRHNTHPIFVRHTAKLGKFLVVPHLGQFKVANNVSWEKYQFISEHTLDAEYVRWEDKPPVDERVINLYERAARVHPNLEEANRKASHDRVGYIELKTTNVIKPAPTPRSQDD